ncbi:aminotransferase class III-fold pyridoxal phosphate-dependent enzyme [Pectobacterium polonicum]|uniref:aspartate aminotransferase family protein n=1 Tax=Pectobacterium polonicum TaxID=2485124 RepID=UPI0010F6251E|nr:aminotransferase class III-fold pyridoxal phosphate-dependent enzyme [Pectobacterium polonicum]TKY81643.1 aspartate aminotransferase family protein [Pectobacterium polonicum]GKW26349.1 aminotransferase [Pectobacterium carotovorum subsp. carotovorum]
MAQAKDIVPGFYTIDDAIALDGETTRALQLTHLNRMRSLDGHAKYFVRAEGSTFIDDQGEKHLDMIGAVGVVTVGNNNEFVWSCLQKCFDNRLFMMGAISYHNVAAALAHNMALLSPQGKLTKMGTATGGAEAIEGMIKLVKLGTRHKAHKTHLLATLGAFHGKTSGAVSLGGKDKWRAGQQPTLGNIDHVTYGSIPELEGALATGKYKAFVVEPIQGEGGIIVPPAGYLKAARELCDRYDTLLVLDEIQCGAARTGKFWCCEHDDVVPDCIVFAKGLSGGLVPFGGYLCTENLYEAAYGTIETCYHHTATYQENTLSAAAALGSLQFIIEHDLCGMAERKGALMMQRLYDIQARHPQVIKEVRGKGLMIGIEFGRLPEALQASMGEYYSMAIAGLLVEKWRIQVNFTINNLAVFRFLPALTISEEELDYALNAFESALISVVEQAEQANTSVMTA